MGHGLLLVMGVMLALAGAVRAGETAPIDIAALQTQASALDGDPDDCVIATPAVKRFREAAAIRQRILEADRASLPADSPALAEAMDDLAWDDIKDATLSWGMFHDPTRGKAMYANARVLLQAAQKIYERSHQADDERIARLSFHLALLPETPAERQAFIARHGDR